MVVAILTHYGTWDFLPTFSIEKDQNSDQIALSFCVVGKPVIHEAVVVEAVRKYSFAH